MDYVVDKLLELEPEEMEFALDDYSHNYLDAIYDDLMKRLENEIFVDDFIIARNERDGYGTYKKDTPYEKRLTTLIGLVRDRMESQRRI